MPWVYLDDHFDEHEKVTRAGGDAAWLYIAGLCYVNRRLSGGVIPRALVPRLTDRKNPMKLAQKLVEVVLWEERGEDFFIHDYERYNRTAEARRAKARAAASARWDAPSNAPSMPDACSDDASSPLPSPLVKESSSSEPLVLSDPEEEEIRKEARRRLRQRRGEPLVNSGAWLRKTEASIREERRNTPRATTEHFAEGSGKIDWFRPEAS